MMKISQQKLQAVCSILQALVPECRLMITPEGWNTQAVDTANVAMVSLNLPKGGFLQYDETDKCEIGMDLTKWGDMLKIMSDKGSTIEIVRDNGRLRITDGHYTITHTPLDPNTIRKRPNPPNLSLPATIEIGGEHLREAIRAMGIIADKVRLGSDKEGLALHADGDTDHLDKVIETAGTCTVPDQAVRSLFSLDYLSDISKAMKDAKTITVLLGQDHPVRFDCEIEGAEVSYLVAPRLGDE